MISTLPPVDDELVDEPPEPLDEAPPQPESAMHAAATAAAPAIRPLFHFMPLHSFVIRHVGDAAQLVAFLTITATSSW